MTGSPNSFPSRAGARTTDKSSHITGGVGDPALARPASRVLGSGLRPGSRPYLPIIDLAFSGVIAVVATVTVVGTLSAQSSSIDFAMSIASGAPVG